MEPPDRTTGISAPPASLLSGLSAGTLGFEALLQDAVSHASQLHTLHQTASEAAPPPPACTRPVYPTWQQAPPPPAMPSARLLPPMAGASPPAEEATEAASESKGKQKGKGKGKAKGQAKEQTKRVKWSNKMVGELLRLRFSAVLCK